MSPGRASSGLTTCRLFVPASAARTQVCTAAQPPPCILWPDCSSDHVTKLAHHGLPGATPAAARYLLTSVPVLTPSSCTPLASSPLATSSADAPRLLAPAAFAEAASATAAGTESGAATALGGPAGGWIARNTAEPPFFTAASAASALTATNEPESPISRLGSGGGAAAAAAWGGAAAGGAGAWKPSGGGSS